MYRHGDESCVSARSCESVDQEEGSIQPSTQFVPEDQQVAPQIHSGRLYWCESLKRGSIELLVAGLLLCRTHQLRRRSRLMVPLLW
jgi:hypothetical protein